MQLKNGQTMGKPAARKLLMEWVSTNCHGYSKDAIHEDVLLMKVGVLDSLGVMSLITYVEVLLGREIPDELMSFDNFESIRKIQDVFFSEMTHEG